MSKISLNASFEVEFDYLPRDIVRQCESYDVASFIWGLLDEMDDKNFEQQILDGIDGRLSKHG